MELKICVYSIIDFYLIEKKYPQTRKIANFGKNLTYPPMKKPDLHPWRGQFFINFNLKYCIFASRQ